MSGESRNIVLDTNVLIDLVMHRSRGESAALRLLDECVERNLNPMCVSLSLKDVDYIVKVNVKREFKDAMAGVERITVRQMVSQIGWTSVESILGVCEVAPVDGEVCAKALELRSVHPDYEDDLIVAASRQAGADMVVTGDQTLIRHFPDLCVSVEDALKRVESQSEDGA
ncbi:PIN domain-containing protein [Bifidobacterium sp. ESL0763]|uniref:type II toxin-antitoxin system VapC family toxin n=1 Tax=Bifidobacterium sp. ESL0763 TaxID=2983227 RepID=UPI0023F71BD8|nr:PIN domain-containing protein [Bifidobacterium sp. ESL0763]MDF7663603.1 PIN domain-containing protein [Bifidobacterium sp. ESL0763]